MHATRLKTMILFTCAASLVATILYLGMSFLAADVFAQASPQGVASIDPSVLRWGYMAAAIATGASTLSAGIAVASVGTAAVGALAERPELFGRTLVMVGLAEGIAIYGMIISIIILNRLA